MDATGEEEPVSAGVVKLLVVVAVNYFDGGAKLGMHISKEIGECGIRVRFKA